MCGKDETENRPADIAIPRDSRHPNPPKASRPTPPRAPNCGALRGTTATCTKYSIIHFPRGPPFCSGPWIRGSLVLR
jgi:hypothetical protein